jgi:predicted transcriptional regulator of viral defense system
MNANQMPTLKSWIVHRERTGRPCFSSRDVAEAYPSRSPNAVHAALSHFCATGLLQRVHRGFFCVVPARYALRGRIPADYYIGPLMQWLGKPYYVAALSAAAHWGAAHQKVMVTQVMTELPHSSTSGHRNPDIFWLYRKRVPKAFLVRENGENGPLLYSNPVLTALDLVRWAGCSGGISFVASVLDGLRDAIDFSGAADGVFRFVPVPDIQRLGYLFDVVLEDASRAGAIFGELRRLGVFLRPVLLSPGADSPVSGTNPRWKIRVNAAIDWEEA